MMKKDEAIKILARHLMQCGMMMPIEWVQKNGEDGEFMQAYQMAMDALKNEPVPCKDCSHCRETIDRFGAGLFCSRWNRDWQRVQPDDFCSYGERKNE